MRWFLIGSACGALALASQNWLIAYALGFLSLAIPIWLSRRG